MKKIGRWSLALAAVLAALAGPARAGESYDIDVILPMTGPAAFLGQSVLKTMQVAERVINEQGGIAQGLPVHFVFHDDETNPQQAVTLAGQIAARHPAVVFGSVLAALCNAMAPLMKDGPVLYCLSPAVHPPAGSFVYTASVATRDYIEALMRYFRMRGITRIAMLSTTDVSGQEADAALATVLGMEENAGVHLVDTEHFNTADLSVTAQVEKMREANPQLLVVWATGAAVATPFRAIAQLGIELPVISSTSTMTFAQMQQYAAFLPRQLYFATPEWVCAGEAACGLQAPVAAAQRLYFERMQAANLKPDAASETGWDPPMVVAAVLRKLGPTASAAQLRQGMAALTGFSGIDGIYDYPRTPQRGINIANTVVARWDAGRNYWVAVSQPGGAPLAAGQ